MWVINEAAKGLGSFVSEATDSFKEGFDGKGAKSPEKSAEAIHTLKEVPDAKVEVKQASIDARRTISVPPPPSQQVPEVPPTKETKKESTEKIGQTRSALLAMQKVIKSIWPKGEEYAKDVDPILDRLKAIKSDADLLSNEELKADYKKYAALIVENTNVIKLALKPEQMQVIETNLGIIRSNLWSTTSKDVPSDVAMSAPGWAEDKMRSFLTNTLWLDGSGTAVKAILWVAWILGVFKAGSFFSKIFDWIADPIEKAKQEWLGEWAHPIDLAKRKANETWDWIQSKLGFGGITIPTGKIVENGKVYQNDKLGVASKESALTIAGKRYNLSLDWTPAVPLFQPGTRDSWDLVVIGDYKLAVAELKNRVEASKEEKSIVVWEGDGKKLTLTVAA